MIIRGIQEWCRFVKAWKVIGIVRNREVGRSVLYSVFVYAVLMNMETARLCILC